MFSAMIIQRCMVMVIRLLFFSHKQLNSGTKCNQNRHTLASCVTENKQNI